tara:strand:- start:437 stop:868 length:432 start_codon:yes stop_codon:yes gene_type:complete
MSKIQITIIGTYDGFNGIEPVQTDIDEIVETHGKNVLLKGTSEGDFPSKEEGPIDTVSIVDCDSAKTFDKQQKYQIRFPHERFGEGFFKDRDNLTFYGRQVDGKDQRTAIQIDAIVNNSMRQGYVIKHGTPQPTEPGEVNFGF